MIPSQISSSSKRIQIMSRKIWLKIFIVFMHFKQRLKALKWVQLPQQCQCKLLSLFQTPPFSYLYFREHFIRLSYFIRLSLSFKDKFGFKWTHLLWLWSSSLRGACYSNIFAYFGFELSSLPPQLCYSNFSAVSPLAPLTIRPLDNRWHRGKPNFIH